MLMMETSTLHIVASTSIWTALYVGQRLLRPSGSIDLQCRTLSAIHGFLVSSLSAVSLYYTYDRAFTNLDAPATTLQYVIGLIAIGYFIYDIGWCLLTKPEHLGFYIIHHIMCIGSIVPVIYSSLFGTEMVLYLFVHEVTNPPIQLEAFFNEYGKRTSWMGILNKVTLAVSHVIFRVLVGTLLLYFVVTHAEMLLFYKVAAVAIYFLGWSVVMTHVTGLRELLHETNKYQ